MGFLLLALLGVFVSSSVHLANSLGLENLPATISLHENHDNSLDLLKVIGTCSEEYKESYACKGSQESYSCNCYRSWWTNYCHTCYRDTYSTCQRTQTRDAPCSACRITSQNTGSHFQILDGFTIEKKTCREPGCGPTCSESGCLNYPDVYTITVECYHDSRKSSTISGTLTVTTVKNEAPTFYFENGDDIEVPSDRAGQNSVINKMIASDVDGVDQIYYTVESGPEPSEPSDFNGNILFALNTDTGEIYVTRDLSREFTSDYTMTVCVHDRRHHRTCQSLTIHLKACFQTPVCEDQTLSITEEFEPNTLTIMTVQPIDDHFKQFGSWSGLRWEVNADDIVEIDRLTGELSVRNKFSVYPAYPTKTYNYHVKVSNTGSCVVSQCSVRLIVEYVNYAPKITSLDSEPSIAVNEDDDEPVILHSLGITDDSPPLQDNVTCMIDSVTPDEKHLFKLVQDPEGAYTSNSWRVMKTECMDRTCGYKYSPVPFQCPKNSGCLNHAVTSSYDISITCQDAYGLSDTGTFTMNVLQNSIPKWGADKLELYADDYLEGQVVYNLEFTDDEDELMVFEYTWFPQDDGFLVDPASGVPANIATLTNGLDYSGISEDVSYTVTICGYERRNELCKKLFVDIKANIRPTTNPEDENNGNSGSQTTSDGGHTPSGTGGGHRTTNDLSGGSHITTGPGGEHRTTNYHSGGSHITTGPGGEHRTKNDHSGGSHITTGPDGEHRTTNDHSDGSHITTGPGDGHPITNDHSGGSHIFTSPGGGHRTTNDHNGNSHITTASGGEHRTTTTQGGRVPTTSDQTGGGGGGGGVGGGGDNGITTSPNDGNSGCGCDCENNENNENNAGAINCTGRTDHTLDNWCTLSCNHIPPFCPPGHCSCQVNMTTNVECESVGPGAGADLDRWCNDSCNHDLPDCPSFKCKCKRKNEDD